MRQYLKHELEQAGQLLPELKGFAKKQTGNETVDGESGGSCEHSQILQSSNPLCLRHTMFLPNALTSETAWF